MTENKNMKTSSLSKRTRMGSYTFILTVLLLALLIVVNLLVKAIPERYTSFDTTPQKLYTMSEGTKKYLSALEEDVTLNWICPGGEPDENDAPYLAGFLERYTALTPRLTLKIIDPIADPAAFSKFGITEGDKTSDYSLIIESGRRTKLVEFSSLFYYYNEALAEAFQYSFGTAMVPSWAYSYYSMYFSQAEAEGYPTEEFFHGDDIITKAVEYVALERIPHIYILAGHGEDLFSELLLGTLTDNNIKCETLNLTDAGSVPDDANCVVIYSPSADLSVSERAILGEYLGGGGNMLLITSPDDTGLANLLSLVEPYGVTALPGIVYEGSASHYIDTEYRLKPLINTNHPATAYSSSYSVLMPKSHAISVGESTGGANVTKLLTTSETALIKLGDDDYAAGELILGVAIEKQADNGGNTQIVWYSSAEAFTDTVSGEVSYGNYNYMFYTLYWMDESYDSALSNVTGIPTGSPRLDKLNAGSIYFWGIAFVIILPATFLITGLVIWLRRRRR